jgi:endoglucanase
LSRIRWTERLVDLLDENNISFAYWEFCAGFGIYNPRTQIYDWGLINALIKKRTK